MQHAQSIEEFCGTFLCFFNSDLCGAFCFDLGKLAVDGKVVLSAKAGRSSTELVG